MFTVTCMVNGKVVTDEELKNIEITDKSYIEYVEGLKKMINKRIMENWEKEHNDIG